jgi:hypothetical protein
MQTPLKKPSSNRALPFVSNKEFSSDAESFLNSPSQYETPYFVNQFNSKSK